jgi:putative membrane protein
MPRTSTPPLVNVTSGRSFWKDVFTWHGSVTPVVISTVLGFGGYGVAIGAVHEIFDWEQLGAVPAQFTAAILVLLLVLRNNSGYERWWEARRLWGGIVNQSRNLAVSALGFGGGDVQWREQVVRWTAAFSLVARNSLRGSREIPELAALLGDAQDAERVRRAQHMPSVVALQLSRLLGDALARGQLSGYAFLQLDRERALLVDHIGGCERILKTPLPLVHTIKLRRFIVLYLAWLPFAVVGETWWLPGVITALVSYPLIAIDRIAFELENPFAVDRLSHLPLSDICQTIESNLLALLAQARDADRDANET